MLDVIVSSEYQVKQETFGNDVDQLNNGFFDIYDVNTEYIDEEIKFVEKEDSKSLKGLFGGKGSGKMNLKVNTDSDSISLEKLLANRKVKFSSAYTPKASDIGPIASPSILKNRTGSPRELEKLRRMDEQREFYRLILQKGAVMKKVCLSGKMVTRFVYLSPDCTELRWKKVFKGYKTIGTTKMELATVESLLCGPRTHPFESYDWVNGKPYNCFSLMCMERSVDFVCSDKETFMNWYLGLQFFVPMAHSHLNRAQLNWHRMFCKLVQFSVITDQSLIDVFSSAYPILSSPSPDMAGLPARLSEVDIIQKDVLQVVQSQQNDLR